MSWNSRARTKALATAVAWLALTTAGAAHAAETRQATDVRVTPTGTSGAASVAVTFSEAPTFSARLAERGKRLIVDVPNAVVRGAPGALVKKVGLVGGVLLQSFDAAGTRTTRLLVSLEDGAKHAVAVSGNQLVVTVWPEANTASQPVREAQKDPAPEAKVDPVVRVLDVRFEHGSLQDEVVVQLSQSAEFKSYSPSTGRANLVISDASLPKGLERTLDVTAFDGVVNAISSFPGRKKGTVVLEAESDGDVVADVRRQGTSLVWSFHRKGKLPPSMTGVGRDGGPARKSRTVHTEEAVGGIADVHDGYGVTETQTGDLASGFTPAIAGQDRDANFAGRRIDLDLKDADIHNVLRLLADVGRVNIVTADNVSGNVTIRMRNVPWDQALDVVLQAKSLGMVRRGNMIRVAPLVDLEKEREMQIAKRKQELQLAPLETRLVPVSYAEAADIQLRAKEMLSPRGSIAVDERTNVLIVRDVAGNLNQIEELTRSLDTQTPQVLVEARIVEATSRYLRDVGIQWGGDATFSSSTGNPTGLVFPNSVGLAGGASDADTPTAGLSPFQRVVQNPNFAVNLPATVGTGSGGALGLTFGSVDNTINLGVRLSAAESSGMLRILSSPRILTLDNHEARISQGTLIPFSQISAQGVQTTFQEAKLQLLVKPHVTADGSVSMHVKINRDEPDFNQTSARGDPTILKREAETDLLVMDGHTAVIGGIFTRNTGRNLDQVPFFGDIPLIGLLFQRRRASDTRGELVIFLTPRIVNRAEALGR